MKSKRPSSNSPKERLQLRVLFGDKIAIGPGKADLLRSIRETGSISEAARQMGMSYMRAWTLIRTMNVCCRQPVVSTARGGHEKGGARLTTTGQRLLQLYAELENQCSVSTTGTLSAIGSLLRPAPKSN